MRRNVKPNDGTADVKMVSVRRRRRNRRHVDETDQLVAEVIRILSSVFTTKNVTITFICCVLILISCVGVIWPNPCYNGAVSSSILQNFGTIFSSREWNASVLEDAKQGDTRCMCNWMWLNDNVTAQDCYNNGLMNGRGDYGVVDNINITSNNTSNGSNNRMVPPSCFFKGFGIGPTEIYRNTVVIACALRTSVRIGVSNGSLVGGLFIIPSAVLQISGRCVLLIVDVILSIVNNTLVPIVRWFMEEVALHMERKRSWDMEDSANNNDSTDGATNTIGSDVVISDLSSFMSRTNFVTDDDANGHYHYDWHIVPKSFSLVRTSDSADNADAPTIIISADDEVTVDILTMTTVRTDAHRRFLNLPDIVDVNGSHPRFKLSIRFKSSPYACIKTSHFTNQQGSLFKRINEISIGNDRLAKQRVREVFEVASKDDYFMMREEEYLSSLLPGSMFGQGGTRSNTLECSSSGQQVPVYDGSVLIRIYEVHANDSDAAVTIAEVESRYHISSNVTLDDDEKSRLLQGIVREAFWSNEPMKPWRDAFNNWFKKSSDHAIATLTNPSTSKSSSSSAPAQVSVSNLWSIELDVTDGRDIVYNDRLSTFRGSFLESSVTSIAFTNLISRGANDDGEVNNNSNFKIHSVHENTRRDDALVSFVRNIVTKYCDNDSVPCSSLVIMKDVHFWIVLGGDSGDRSREISITISRHSSHYSERNSYILQALRYGMSKQESDSALFSDSTFSCWFSYFSSSIARHFGISKQLILDHYTSSPSGIFNDDDLQTILAHHNHWIEFEKYFVVAATAAATDISDRNLSDASDFVSEAGSVLQSYRANPSMSHICPHIISTSTMATTMPRKSLLLNLRYREDVGHRGLTNVIIDDNGRSRVFNVMMKLINDAGILPRKTVQDNHRLDSGGGGGGGITVDNLFAVESYLVEMCRPASVGEVRMNFIQCLDGAFSLAYYRHWMSPELSLLTTISNIGDGGSAGDIHGGIDWVESFRVYSNGTLIKDVDDTHGSLSRIARVVIGAEDDDSNRRRMKKSKASSSFIIVDENDQVVVDDAERMTNDHVANDVGKRRLLFRSAAALAVECVPTSSQIQRYPLNPRHLSVRLYNISACV